MKYTEIQIPIQKDKMLLSVYQFPFDCIVYGIISINLLIREIALEYTLLFRPFNHRIFFNSLKSFGLLSHELLLKMVI